MAVISLENVSKRYYLHRERELLAQRAWRWGRRPQQPFWALQDVSFSVGRGESVGVIGHNGAGKSTLLGIIVGVTNPTNGRVVHNGRISAMLELGTGFHPDMSGAENIQLNGALLGMSREEVARKYDSIVDFGEMDAFIDEPVRTYSSGMLSRLGFSVAIHLEPEIVLLDEVLAVGDQAFQKKCINKMTELTSSGTTVMLVSHSMIAVENMCERAIWIDHGQVKMDGPATEVVEAYSGSS